MTLSPQHISAILQGARNPGKVENGVFQWLRPGDSIEWIALRLENADQVGAMLWRQNLMSVNHRYGSKNPVDREFSFSMATPLRSPLELLKLVECYHYNSCDHPSWKTSEAKSFTEQLQFKLIRELPGYDAAPWDI